MGCYNDEEKHIPEEDIILETHAAFQLNNSEVLAINHSSVFPLLKEIDFIIENNSNPDYPESYRSYRLIYPNMKFIRLVIHISYGINSNKSWMTIINVSNINENKLEILKQNTIELTNQALEILRISIDWSKASWSYLYD